MTTQVTERSTASGREAAGALLVSAAIVGCLWLLTSARGAVGIARADDWSYLLTQFRFAETGEFVLNNWAVTMLVGQTIAAWPVTAIFGSSIPALQAFIAFFGVLALTITYLVLRGFLSRWMSALAVLTLALGPLFGSTAITFMTDIPAFAFAATTIALGIGGMRRPEFQVRWWAAAAVTGVIAFTFRDYMIISLVVVLVIAATRFRMQRGPLLTVVSILAIALITALVLYVWRHSLPLDLKLEGWSFEYSVALVARALTTLSLLVLPALVVISPARVVRELRLVPVPMLVLVGLMDLGVILAGGREFLGNLVHPFGFTWLVAGEGVRMWPLAVNRILLVISYLAFIFLSMIAVVVLRRVLRSMRSEGVVPWIDRQAGRNGARTIVITFPVVLFAAHVGATLIAGAYWIDRYFIAIVPFLAGALILCGQLLGLRVAGVWRSIAPITLALFAGWGIHVVDVLATTDAARWQVAENLVSQGVPASAIDGGMEWVSFHEPEPGLPAQIVDQRPGRPWWTERYPDRIMCRTILFVDDVDPQVAAPTYRSLFGVDFMAVVREGPDPCP